MADVSVVAERLTKRFGDRVAVDGVSFTAHEGEVLGLLGRNGAGKTTTIRVLTTVLAATGGTFQVAGVPHTRPGDLRRRVGVLAESAGYPGHQTGQEYLSYHGRLFGLSRTEARRTAERLLTQVGLRERGGSRIATYSRGMRQRLGIARALVNDPLVVFLDEPTLGLDPVGHRQVLELVRDIAQRRGSTVVLSTHLLTDVEEVCTSVLILDGGKVVARGPVGEIARAAAAPRRAALRVPVEQVDRATRALAAVAGLTLETADDRPDVLRIAATGTGGAGMNAALEAVLRAGVPVLSFDVEGARLSDAFLAVTREGVR
jgi:ABC-2 type transport system ATP-binding protein